MKNLLIIATALFLLFAINTNTNAQVTPSFGQGQIDVNLGLGLGATGIGVGFRVPLSLSVDYGITDRIAIGVQAGFTKSKVDVGYGKWNFTNIFIGARGSYHYPLLDKLDTYGGLALGANIYKSKFVYNDDILLPGGGETYATPGALYLAAFVGARYAFSNKFAAFAEIGYGASWLTVGINMAF